MSAFEIRKDGEFEGMREEVYSKAVRAGRRTYFFDVKATRNDDYFLTITESRKNREKTGGYFFDKHKIYLYKEDFAKFSEGLEEVIGFIKKNKPEFFENQLADSLLPETPDDGLSTIDVEFDIL